MSHGLDHRLITEVVREVLRELGGELSGAAPASLAASANDVSALQAPQCKRPDPPLHELAAPVSPDLIEPLVRSTSSQLCVGHSGTRFKTDLYLRIREGHADAKDAVHSEVPAGWAEQHGLVALKSRCKERHEYLLYPNHGRRLDEASLAKIDSLRGSRPDVQVILGDGLSSLALLKNGKACLDELTKVLTGAGLRLGQPLFVRYARIGVADEIGVHTGARATVIVVGERPGLGTGDSLSFYLAVNPKLDQDNAEKNCISNVRPVGMAPHEAAELAGKILQRAFELGGGGVAVGIGYGRN